MDIISYIKDEHRFKFKHATKQEQTLKLYEELGELEDELCDCIIVLISLTRFADGFDEEILLRKAKRLMDVLGEITYKPSAEFAVRNRWSKIKKRKYRFSNGRYER